MSHYFSEKPNARREQKKHEVALRGRSLTFVTDAAVFSKSGVDYGTKVLLDSFAFPATDGDILDVGCGWGPIGVTLASEDQNRMVWMVDVNERAVQLAQGNAEKNNLQNVKVLKSDLFQSLKGQTFAAILTNPPIRAGKDTIHTLFEQAYDYLVPGGELWIVIQKKQGAPSAKKKLQERFKEVETVRKDKGYYIFRAEKY
ncbi:class I SAM-dependent methyltransferase [Texcoconibacillus texcoconensis]|uniref:16S rRNA (Guanine1207-N2)-methyltransferase n=1 Tax=Texcoconibacillus texcoconensis TaxID=1095777 RepID=A0A840QUD4_9BACI|nr:class I SAM-dependent methyltransferase [Texcoconibacillus texcoconensis]MBB5174995.1 16S rRNA (guanine1207-N2)-methyltransferase [Texcoconibacillus texcoconensis]